ncbi:MAG TPA: RagB/SusD family nutrient uptake outer membrane protein [Longimicrobiaceae bacterium]|nr:RagB/SusD family nutrient uptake outer membrane protein [Longimicrobiaceae bacterium]
MKTQMTPAPRPRGALGRPVRLGIGSLLVVLLALLSASCENHALDIQPQDRLAEDAVWNDAKLIQAYENELYNGIPHGFYKNMYSKYTDEAYNSAPCCGNIFARNTYSPENIASVGGGDYWGGYMYYWDRGYQYIRKVNVFLQKMSERTEKIPDQDRLVAEARFLRAFMYFNLIERFGGVPIVDKAYDLADVDSVQFKRNTFDEVVAFIEQDLDAAMPDLPARYLSTDPNFGRATQDAAMALRSRVLLYAASPLFNPTNDRAKWQKAADAAAALLDRGYSLYPDYRKLFMLPSGAPEDEYIFVRNFTTTNGHEVPMDNLNRRYGAYGGWWGSNGPSQNLVDDYDMTDGEPPFHWVNGEQVLNPTSGYDPQHPYANRDPRFDATIIHDGTVYRGDTFEMWEASDGSTWGYDSYKQSGDNPKSDYVLKKFMPDEDVPLSWQTTYTTPWPFFRLAEIYLNYAEAEFELGNEPVAREYVSKVRARVGMPPIPASVTGEELRQRIYNERRIELAFEGQRFFDIRRWKIADKIENRPIRGMRIIKDVNTGVKTYEPYVLLEKEPWEEKMYLLPIASDEIRRNPELTQAPGW